MGKFLVFTFATFGFFYLYNKIKDYIKAEKNKRLLQQARARKHQVYLKTMQKYDAIECYSICLSIDYKTKRTFTKENKKVVNKIIFLKIKDYLNKMFSNIEIYNFNDAVIVKSGDFEIYDAIYDSIIKILSKIKQEVDERYCIYMIPSITTDAHKTKPDIETIKINHQNIKHCNFTGMSCSTKIFSEKYQFMNRSKYMGKPIGEYTILDKEKENKYDLNLISKNLSNQLESLGV